MDIFKSNFHTSSFFEFCSSYLQDLFQSGFFPYLDPHQFHYYAKYPNYITFISSLDLPLIAQFINQHPLINQSCIKRIATDQDDLFD